MKTDLNLAISIMIITVVVSAVYIWLTTSYKNFQQGKKRAFIHYRFVLIKITGLMFHGIIPALLVKVLFNVDFSGFMKVSGISDVFPITVISLLIIILILLNILNSRAPAIQRAYPEMRLAVWNLCSVLIGVFGWIVYLLGYEFLFRGLLLASCVDAFGPAMAVGINIVLYFLLHLHKSIKEALATIPFGLVICYITLKTGSILPAVIIHSVQAISIELACIYRNKNMRFSFLSRRLI